MSSKKVHFRYVYDEHVPWKVERLRGAIARLRANPEDDSEEVRSFRATHPKMAELALMPEATSSIEYMLTCREDIETGTASFADVSAQVQETVLRANQVRASNSRLTTHASAPLSEASVEEGDGPHNV